MIAYKKEKLENTICYLASEHFDRTGKYLSQTILYKFLAFLDFETLKETGKPSLELEYRALKRGPVPHKIYNNLKKYENPDYYKFYRSGFAIIIVPQCDANLDYFSEDEINIMTKLLDKYSKPDIGQRDICGIVNKDSHEIEAWKVAWEKEHNSIIEYDDLFRDLEKKSPEDLTIQEENYFTYKGLKEINSCR